LKNFQNDEAIRFIWNRDDQASMWFSHVHTELRTHEIRKYGDVDDYGPELTKLDADTSTGKRVVTYDVSDQGDLTLKSSLNSGRVVIVTCYENDYMDKNQQYHHITIKSHKKGTIEFYTPLPECELREVGRCGRVLPPNKQKTISKCGNDYVANRNDSAIVPTAKISWRILKDSYTFGGTEWWIDYRTHTSHEAVMNIIYMWFIIVIFIISSLVFMGDINALVIDPVEGMTSALTLISEKVMDLGGSSNDAGEAHFIENSVVKIVSLLKVSFGEAGTKIIQANMSSDSSKLNTKLPGVTVDAIFGMCDIRSFTSVTEALNEEIVIFVNEFAKIVHEQTVFTDGAPNKNVGDSFLSVWKEQEDYSRKSPETGEDMSSKADLALHCYRKAIYLIRQSEPLGRLITKKEIYEMYEGFEPEKKRFPTFLPRMGFGMHYGKAIEGAVGTDLKMDASYLGPEVDLADVLEGMTKDYGCCILMSEQFYALLSDEMKSTCRLVDRVTAGAVNTPFNLYSANVKSVNGDYFDRDIMEEYLNEKDELSMEDKAAIEAKKQDLINMGIKSEDEVEALVVDPEHEGAWKELLDVEYNNFFETGVQKYIDGQWDEAVEIFNKCLDQRPYDLPAEMLRNRMTVRGEVKSTDEWPGYWSGHE